MNDRFVAALNELMTGSGISNNELARRIDVDPAQIGRWRKGLGRPRPENLVRAAAVFGIDHEWLWSLAYPRGIPASADLDPRLAAFLAEIEAGWRTMGGEALDVAERGARALFHVPPTRRPKHPGDPINPNTDKVFQDRSRHRPYQSQSVTTQIAAYGFQPAMR